MKKLVATLILLGLSLTGCASPEAAPEPSLRSLSWAELKANDEYVQWLDGYCQHENLDKLVKYFSFLPLDSGETASSLEDVMASRTARFEEALGSQSKELEMLTEFAEWDQYTADYPQAWAEPSQTLTTSIAQAYKQSLQFLGDGLGFNTKIGDQVNKDWLDSCGYTEMLSVAMNTITPYEEALGKVTEAAIKRFESQGYEDFGGVILYKLRVMLTGASNRFEVQTIQYRPCSAEFTAVGNLDFTVPGKKGSDGITNVAITVSASEDLDDERNAVGTSRLWAEHFSVYENDYEPAEAAKQNDFNAAELTEISCSPLL